MLAAVTTTGVNPEALIATLGPLLAMLAGGIKWLAGRVDQHHNESTALLNENTDLITHVQRRVDQINEKGSLPMQGLSNRLATIESHLERQDLAQRELGERIARLEGPVRAAAERAGD